MKSVKDVACPFCKKADRIKFYDYTSEQEDGTETEQEAAKCTRCDMIAPLAAWKRLRKLPAKRRRATPEALKRMNSLIDGIFDKSPISNSDISSSSNVSQYWTLHREGGISASLAAQTGTLPSQKAFPHEGLCRFGFDTPDELLNQILIMGRDPSEIFLTGDRLARVCVKSNGLFIEFFGSWQAASEAQAIFLESEIGYYSNTGNSRNNPDNR